MGAGQLPGPLCIMKTPNIDTTELLDGVFHPIAEELIVALDKRTVGFNFTTVSPNIIRITLQSLRLSRRSMRSEIGFVGDEIRLVLFPEYLSNPTHRGFEPSICNAQYSYSSPHMGIEEIADRLAFMLKQVDDTVRS